MYGQPTLVKYPEEVRKFCYALNYHSPAGYQVFRNQFDKRFPHPKTLSAWLSVSDINGEHGFREETMKRLTGFVNDLREKSGEPLICALLLDEMYIKKQVYWDQNKFEYVGYPTYGNVENVHNEDDENQQAGPTMPEGQKKSANEANESGETDAGETIERRITRSFTQTIENHAEAIGEEPQADNPAETDETSTRKKNAKKAKKKCPLATRAMVFMLSGINKCFEFPFGYHFVNGLGGPNLAKLVTEVIEKVSECGVKISNLTFDGAKENIQMCELLGANMDATSDDFRPFISSPYDGSNIYLILDPSHMEKLLRNLLGNHGVIFDGDNNRIEWSYFVDLQEISRDGNLLTHKLTRKHTTEFKRNKMNVRLAVETYSGSVADSMEILKEKGHPKFLNSGPTIKFIRMVDRLFDILNTRDTRQSNVYKQPLYFANKRQIFEFIEESKAFLRNLQMFRVRQRNNVKKKVKLNVLDTLCKTPVLGFLANLTNLPLMYAEFVEEDENNPSLKKMTHFRTYAFSQDRIEHFFGKIRARNGYNNNPNCAQFKGAFRRLQANIEINPPTTSNCMMFDPIDLHMFVPQSNLYSVSSRRPKFDVISDDNFKNNLKTFETEQQNLEDTSDLQGMKESNHMFDGFADTSIAYASKLIEQSIISAEFHCECCKFVFEENEKLNDGSICLIPSKTPCLSTYKICKIADKYFSLYKPSKEGCKSIKGIDFRVLYFKIFDELDCNKIFVNTDFKDHEQHKFYLVKCIVKNYIHIKTAHISKELTYEEYGKIIRTKLTKWIHFQGQ